MDDIDRKILAELQEDGWLAVTEMIERMGEPFVFARRLVVLYRRSNLG